MQLGVRADRVYRDLLRLIEKGTYGPDSRLPIEPDLCDRYKVSRNTIRKAVERLAAERRIVRRQGSGTFVLAPVNGSGYAKIVSVMYGGTLADLSPIQGMILKHGHILSFFSQMDGCWDPHHEKIFLQHVLQQKHRALLAFCSPYASNNDNLLRDLDKAGIRVIHIEPYREALPEQNYLMPDYRQAGYAGAVALMVAGYERLYYAGMETDGPFGRLQAQGFLDALHEQRGAPRRFVRADVEPALANYFELPQRMGQPEADPRLDAFVHTLGHSAGIVCNARSRAALMLDALQKRGLRIPDDIGLICATTSGEIAGRDERLDGVEFDRLALFEKAIDLATRPDFSGIRELVPPRRVRRQTVRRSGRH